MRTLKVLYYLCLFSFFAINWWNLGPREHELIYFLSFVAVMIILQVVCYKKYGEVIRFNTKADTVILLGGMLLLIVVKYIVLK